ncbi:MAG TPA: SUF system NifU family Fe-S cluster assembly protein [Acidocella sp.]|jgi:nitrogen fixation NifU-like protein|nr:SUF system NifU family Fe-S cluster assembly protein [Acidocella sp.]
MSELYQKIVLDRTRYPRHAGKPAQFDAHGTGVNKLCGDKVSIYLTREGMDLHHETEGCAILTASADLMAEAAHGKDAAQIHELAAAFTSAVTTGTPNPALGELNALTPVSQFPSRIGCATLPWRALEEALQNV